MRSLSELFLIDGGASVVKRYSSKEKTLVFIFIKIDVHLDMSAA